jgi:hypothetical protein
MHQTPVLAPPPGALLHPRRWARRLLLVGAVAATLSVVTACGGGHGSSTTHAAHAQSSPTDIARAYVAARNNQDASGLCALYAPQLRKLIAGPTGNCVAFVHTQMSKTGAAKYALLNVARETANAGAATITTTRNGGTARLSIPLLRVNGTWRIADIDQVSGF